MEWLLYRLLVHQMFVWLQTSQVPQVALNNGLQSDEDLDEPMSHSSCLSRLVVQYIHCMDMCKQATRPSGTADSLWYCLKWGCLLIHEVSALGTRLARSH